MAIFPYETPNDAAIVDETVEINGNTNCKQLFTIQSYIFLKQTPTCIFFTAQPSEYWYSYAGKWEMRSTGLYAKAGTKVTFTIPESVVGNVHVRLLCRKL